MRKTILLFILACAYMMNVSAQKFVGDRPVQGQDYFIKMAPRSLGAHKVWLTQGTLVGDNSQAALILSTFADAQNQLWNIVPNGNGVCIKNKVSGLYFNADEVGNSSYPQLKLVPNLPTKVLYLGKRTYQSNGWSLDASEFDGAVGDTVSVLTDVAPMVPNTPPTGYTFALYSAGNGPSLRINNNDFYDMIFYTRATVAKQLLKSAIASANDFYGKSFIGPNPGQYSQDDLDGFKGAIDEAEIAFNDPGLNADQYMQAYNNIVTVYNGFLTTNLPSISSEFNEVWFFIQGTRPANTYVTAGTGSTLNDLAINQSDSQLWKLVPNGTGVAFKNKATGEYINSDILQDNPFNSGKVLGTVSAMPANPLQTITSTEDPTNNIHRFWIENVGSTLNFRLHASADGSLMNWTYSRTDNSSWLFFDVAAIKKVILGDELKADTTLIKQVSAGSNPGQVPQSVKNAFQTVIDAALTTYNSSASQSADFEEATTNLSNAKAAYYNGVNLPLANTWYSYCGQRQNLYLSNRSDDSIKYRTASSVQSDSVYWQLVPHSLGQGFALKNKATGHYLNSDISAANGGVLVTAQVDEPATPLKFVRTDVIRNSVFGFSLVNYDATDLSGYGKNGTTFNLHDPSGDAPMNYLDPTDMSAWVLADNKQSIIQIINSLLGDGQTLYVNSAKAEGNVYGQFPQTARSTFKTQLDNVSALDINSLSINDLTTTLDNLTNIISTFKSSKVMNLSTILSTAANPKWFYLTNNGSQTSGFNSYSTDRRIAKNGTSMVTDVASATNTDQMWRFEDSGNGDNSFRLVNKTSNEEFSLSGGDSQAGTIVESGLGTFFYFGDHDNGYGLLLQYALGAGYEPVHNASDNKIVGWNETNNPNSSWRIDPVVPTSVKNLTVNTLKIRNNAGVISVEGVANFELYTILGYRLNNKAVQQKGIYLVKVGNQVQKYILR